MPFWGQQAGIGLGEGVQVKLTDQTASHTTDPVTTATAKYQLNSSGVAKKTADATGLFEDITGEWLFDGLNSDFECRFTKLSGTTLTTDPGTSWLVLSTTREGRLAALGGENFTATYSVEIRRVVDTVVIATATITFVADAT